jgi:hypothetical protein
VPHPNDRKEDVIVRLAERLLRILPEFRIKELPTNGPIYIVKYTEPECVLRITTENHKIKFAPAWPFDFNLGASYKGSTRDANISNDRSDEDIGAEATKRVVTPFLAELPELLAQRDRDRQEAVEKQNRGDEFCKAIDCRRMMDDDNSEELRPTPQAAPHLYAARLNHDATEVELKLSHVPLETAKKVLDLLKEISSPAYRRVQI